MRIAHGPLMEIVSRNAVRPQVVAVNVVAVPLVASICEELNIDPVAYAAMAAKRPRGGDPLSDSAMGKPVGSVMSIGRQRTGMHEV
jgi:hypothetical protein